MQFHPRKLQLNGNEDEANIAMQMLVTHYETLFNTSELDFEYSFWITFVVTNIGIAVTTEEVLFAVFNIVKELI
jgi:hypothetical protein